jgi:hypothetical protein
MTTIEAKIGSTSCHFIEGLLVLDYLTEGLAICCWRYDWGAVSVWQGQID